MQLKQLYLHGFKTFADRTELAIGAGLTAVVGPNGSGKSNVADAVLWVLGEQNPRLLRGSDSRDVIFAGSDKRRQAGMAEVRLTIDNSDGSLPLAFTEVTVTRRVYRSGESQYLLNNAPCRLKDIVELFLDTGMGRGAYGFVSQSEIDAVLSARPEERRELFEEAAGIKKYRVRKREAERRLDSAETSLCRVRDILSDLEEQRAPMQHQAESARLYLTLSARLRTIELDLLVEEARKADYELYVAREEVRHDTDAIAVLQAQIAASDANLASAHDARSASTAACETARALAHAANNELMHLTSEMRLVRERGENAEKSADTLDAEIAALAARAVQLTAEISLLQRDIESAGTRAEQIAPALSDARARLAALNRARDEAGREAADYQLALLKLTELRARQEAASAQCDIRLSETADALKLCETDLELLSAEAGATALQVKQADSEMASARRRCIEAEQRRGELEQRRLRLREAEIGDRAELESLRRISAERGARLATLTELQESGEGFYQGVRSVLRAHRDGSLPGFYAPAVDLLTVPEHLRIAIEIALGGSLQDIVCHTDREAHAAIDWLKKQRAGRATFLALNLVRPPTQLRSDIVSGLPGMVGIASLLIQSHAQYSKVVELLLGRVAIAETIQSAVAASATLQGYSRIVTLEGELLTPGGALTGGSLQGRGSHLVGRKGEIDDLKRDLPTLHADVARAVEHMQQNLQALQQTEMDIEGASSRLALTQSEATTAESRLAEAKREAVKVTARQAESSAKLEQLLATRQRLAVESESWGKARSETDRDDSDQAIARARDAAAKLQKEAESAARTLVELQVEDGRTAERIKGVSQALEAARLTLARTTTDLVDREGQRRTAGARMAAAGATVLELQRDTEAAAERHSTAALTLTGAEQHLADANSAANAAEQAARHASAELTRMQQDQHKSELQIARTEVRLAQAAERLEQEYGLTVAEALRREEVATVDRNTVNEVGRLRREIRAMGNVNTGAVDEYDRLTERFDFLSAQKADLEEAKSRLLATIAEIDESTRDVFMETFTAVQEQFSILFNRLFGEGSTRLILTQPNNLLDTGIEIMAQPPGKKPQHLSLLSGGERALTAVALLFAFMVVRPSPFCLLDEVDAPLDGANVEKFAELLKEFSRNTQFVVITHNPTTIEASPNWYGVTMQEPGVSRVIAYHAPVTMPREPVEPDMDEGLAVVGVQRAAGAMVE